VSETGAIEVARRANSLFSSVPFEQLREIVVSAETYEDVLARLEELGVDPLTDLIDPGVRVDIGLFEGGDALAGGGGTGYPAWLRFWKEWL